MRWSASTDTGGSGLAGYRIYRDGSATPLTSVTGTSFTDGGLAAQSSHSYQVSAYDVAGNVSAAAGPVTGGTLALPDTAAPWVPGDLAVGGTTSSSISLNWSASSDTDGSGLAGYRVYRDGVLVGTVARAAANVMTFNSIASSEAILTSTTVDGFLFSSEHFHLFGDGYYASNGTTHMTYESGRGYPITMSRVDGGTFSLLGFDGAEAVTTSPKDRPAAEAIAIDGFPSGGGTVHVELVLDGITDGGNRNTANDFQGFSLPPSFTNLTSVRFTGIRYSDGRAGGIALDNLALVQGAANPATSFTDSGPAAQGSHSYQVSAYDVAGNESAVAGPVTGTTLTAP